MIYANFFVKKAVFCEKSCIFAPEMEKKIIIIAEEGERKLIADLRERLGNPAWLEGAEVLVTGVGGINIIRSLRGLDRQCEIINIGYAGSANFEIGSIVEVTEVGLNHPNVTYPEPELPLQEHGTDLMHARCYTNCDFVLQSDYRDCVFDMELAFVAALGFAHLSAYKFVSDNLSLHAYHELTNGVE